MSEQDQNIEIVKKDYAAFSGGDMGTIMSLLDDHIEWIQPGESAISGTYHGKGELDKLRRRIAENGTTVRPLRLFAGAHETIDAPPEAVAAQRHDISKCAGWKDAPMLQSGSDLVGQLSLTLPKPVRAVR